MIRALVLVAAGLAVYLAFAVAVGRYLRARNEATPRSNAADVVEVDDVTIRRAITIEVALERIAEEWSNE